jgi:tRNA pseudouridine38-40 synthase
MHSIKLTVSYDGSEFHGWQIQPGKSTVQGALVEVAERLTQHRVQLFGAGRTDAGVHALGQVAHFRTHSELRPIEFQRAFNALLPPAVRVVGAEEVGPDFHARWHALAKTYQYRIYRGRVLSPFDARYVLHDPYPLDAPAMAEAARLFEGTHDFASFAASTGNDEGDRDRSTVREIFSSQIFVRTGNPLCNNFTGLISASLAGPGHVEVRSFDPAVKLSGSEGARASEAQSIPSRNDNPASGLELVYSVRGKSFMRFMVRKIVGTLLDVGRGRLTPADIPKLFDLRDRSKSGPTIAPQGLYLVSVEYPDPLNW